MDARDASSMMTKAILIAVFIGFQIVIYIGYKKINRKLEALIRLNNKKQKNDSK